MYTTEEGCIILIALMKKYGIRKIVLSPGTTNICFVASVQNDSFFQIYSVADERSAAYMACGLSVESGEPVALSCTGATASRNYIPGLTEAFYRKIPVLAITSTQSLHKIGHNIAQVIDRRTLMNDITVDALHIQSEYTADDKQFAVTEINRVLQALTRNGGGPVHINLETGYNRDFPNKVLPDVRKISCYNYNSKLPSLHGHADNSQNHKIGIFVGAHKRWSNSLKRSLDSFCEIYNAVVIYDHTSNYKGDYGVLAALVVSQAQYVSPNISFDLRIDIGDVSGAYMTIPCKRIWRVNPDGKLRDADHKLEAVFEMEEDVFFSHYIKDNTSALNSNERNNAQICQAEYQMIRNKLRDKDIPFSNVWIAGQMAERLEAGILHLGILNSLRSWNFYEISKNVDVYANTGGFGIDGCVSTLVGASLANPEKKYFGVVGDLAFFYDMNVLGNRNVGNNIRLLIINNGCGTEFKNYSHFAAQFGEEANDNIAAMGHYGNKSRELIKHYASDLGYKYLSASDKSEFLENIDEFVNAPIDGNQSILFEVFTNWQEESDALYLVNHMEQSTQGVVKDIAKKTVRSIFGDSGVRKLKSMLKK